MENEKKEVQMERYMKKARTWWKANQNTNKEEHMKEAKELKEDMERHGLSQYEIQVVFLRCFNNGRPIINCGVPY